MKKYTKYLLIGIISIIPAIIVIQISIYVFNIFSSLVLYINNYTSHWTHTIIALFLSISFLIIIGRSVSIYGNSAYIRFIDNIVEKLPLLRSIYSISKKIMAMFFKEEEKFSEVVFIEYPKDGLWVPAYVTNKINNTHLVLFVPTSPNPTSGFTIVVDKKLTKQTKMSMEEATAFIVSIGVDLHMKNPDFLY